MRYFLIIAIACMSAGILNGCSGLKKAETPPSKIETFRIDPTHSSVLFQINHLGVSPFSGRFNNVQGSLSLDQGDIANWSIEVTVKAMDIDTDHDGRDQDLRGKTFFNAEAQPDITFKSTSFENTGVSKYRVHGELTLLGKTLPVTANARHIGTIYDQPQFGTRTGLQAHLTIQRSMFGMTSMMGKLGDEVKLEINIEGVLEE